MPPVETTRSAVFDCFSGIAGDMTLAALVDAGASLDAIRTGLERLGLPPFRLGTTRVARAGIEARLLNLEVEGERTYQPAEMRARVEAANFPARARQRALAAIDALAHGESEAHHTPAPHLHEAGGVDALIDICGTMLALEDLRIAACFCPVVTVGAATIAQTAHGAIPASPGPAASAILNQAGFPQRFTAVSHELVTPTGAAILAAVASPSAAILEVAATGLGAGQFNPGDRPNAIRVFVGATSPAVGRAVSELVANIDDMTPAMVSAARDALLREGALDAWTEPIGMKKGRPAIKLCALVPAGDEPHFAAIFLRETTTLGVRFAAYSRFEATRSIIPFQSSLGPVAVKVSHFAGQTRARPEFDDIARLAAKHGLSAIEVQGIVEAELRQRHDQWDGAGSE